MSTVTVVMFFLVQVNGSPEFSIFFIRQKAEIDVKTIMDTWTLQMGFPVVTIKRAGSNKATATQKHFLLDPNAVVKEPSPFK